MKRVFRSAIDPLPRSLSTPGLIALVAVVMLGIGVTVLRYLESSSPVAASNGAYRSESVQGTGSGGHGAAHRASTGASGTCSVTTGGFSELRCTASDSSSEPARAEPVSSNPGAASSTFFTPPADTNGG